MKVKWIASTVLYWLQVEDFALLNCIMKTAIHRGGFWEAGGLFLLHVSKVQTAAWWLSCMCVIPWIHIHTIVAIEKCNRTIRTNRFPVCSESWLSSYKLLDSHIIYILEFVAQFIPHTLIPHHSMTIASFSDITCVFVCFALYLKWQSTLSHSYYAVQYHEMKTIAMKDLAVQSTF